MSIDDRVRLLDRADTFVRWLDRRDAETLIQRGEVEALGTAKKLRAVRWRRPTPAAEEPEVAYCPSNRIRRLGTAHRERVAQGPYIWTLDRVPTWSASAFRAVVDDCLTDEQAA